MRLLIRFLALTLLPVVTAFAASTTVVLDVQNMTCSLCPVTVKKALQSVPGVDDAKVDFEHKTATVKYDPANADASALVKATTYAGYPLTLHK